MADNNNYFKAISDKIDRLEHPELYESDPVEVEVVSDSNFQPVVSEIKDLASNLPAIESERIDGVLDLYRELNKKFSLNLNVDKVTNITDTFKEIADPTKKEIFGIYLREYMDRLRLVCLNQIGNTVYSLISKLTNEETIRSLTINERVALLDRLFEYMDKVNNMVTLIPRGDTNSELREISAREDSENPNAEKVRNREVEDYIMSLINGKQ